MSKKAETTQPESTLGLEELAPELEPTPEPMAAKIKDLSPGDLFSIGDTTFKLDGMGEETAAVIEMKEDTVGAATDKNGKVTKTKTIIYGVARLDMSVDTIVKRK